MKPLAAYAPAIDTGLLMPGSIIIDEPVTYGGWSPKNWDGKYIGPTTVRQGIWHSINVLAVKTFMMVGADTAYQYLLDFGFTTIDERDKAGNNGTRRSDTGRFRSGADGGLCNHCQRRHLL